MKLLLVISAFVAIAAAAPSEEVGLLYAVDFDAIFANDAERRSTFGCLHEATTCGVKQKFRESVVKVMQNKCADCNQEQKSKYDYVLKKFHDEYESDYNKFIKKMETEKV